MEDEVITAANALVASKGLRRTAAALRGGRGDRRQGRIPDRASLVLDQHQRGHATTPSVLSLATSSSTAT